MAPGSILLPAALASALALASASELAGGVACSSFTSESACLPTELCTWANNQCEDAATATVAAAAPKQVAHLGASALANPGERSESWSIPHGIQTGFPLDSVPPSWKVFYDEVYADNTVIENVTPADECFLWGAKFLAGAEEFSVVTFGRIANVQGAGKTGVWENGAFWYLEPGYSGGFAENSIISLNSCDFAYPSSEQRLCWHLNDRVGGWRAGSVTWLNYDQNWRKVVMSGPCEIECTKQCDYCEKLCGEEGLNYGLGGKVGCMSRCNLHFSSVMQVLQDYAAHGLCPTEAEDDVDGVAAADGASLLQVAAQRPEPCEAALLELEPAEECRDSEGYCKALCRDAFKYNCKDARRCKKHCLQHFDKVQEIFEHHRFSGVCGHGDVDPTSEPTEEPTEEPVSLLQERLELASEL